MGSVRRDYIRAKAFCVVETDGDVLVSTDDDPDTGERYYRPLGGSIDSENTAAMR